MKTNDETTTSNNIDTEQDILAAEYEAATANLYAAIKEAETAVYRDKLIKHLSFYYGLPEAEMKKVAEGAK